MHVFEGHADCIWAVVALGDHLYTASNDHTARQWDISTSAPVRTFSGHKSCVWCLCVDENHLYSGSDDRSARQWSLSTGLCVREFKGHSMQIRCCAVSGGCLFTGSADTTIMQWDTSTAKCLRTFCDHRLEVTSIAVADGYLFSGSDDGSARQHWVTWAGGIVAGHAAPAQEAVFAQKLQTLYDQLGTVASAVEWSRESGARVPRHIHDEEELSRLKMELEQLKALLGTAGPSLAAQGTAPPSTVHAPPGEYRRAVQGYDRDADTAYQLHDAMLVGSPSQGAAQPSASDRLRARAGARSHPGGRPHRLEERFAGMTEAEAEYERRQERRRALTGLVQHFKPSQPVTVWGAWAALKEVVDEKHTWEAYKTESFGGASLEHPEGRYQFAREAERARDSSLASSMRVGSLTKRISSMSDEEILEDVRKNLF